MINDVNRKYVKHQLKWGINEDCVNSIGVIVSIKRGSSETK